MFVTDAMRGLSYQKVAVRGSRDPDEGRHALSVGGVQRTWALRRGVPPVQAVLLVRARLGGDAGVASSSGAVVVF